VIRLGIGPRIFNMVFPVADQGQIINTTLYVTQRLYNFRQKIVISLIQNSFVQLVLFLVNIFALAIFGIDKMKSKRNGWRIPEARLLLFAFFGPFGAYAGMLLFKHKTRKVKFLLVPIFLLTQVAIAVYFYFN
jgi:uncharacterized membrane protein YsdA (DUF1294 family)